MKKEDIHRMKDSVSVIMAKYKLILAISASVLCGIFLAFVGESARLVITYVMTAGFLGFLGAVVQMNIKKDYQILKYCHDLVTLAVIGVFCIMLTEDLVILSGFMIGVLAFDLVVLMKKSRKLLQQIDAEEKIQVDGQNAIFVTLIVFVLLPVRAYRGVSSVTDNARREMHKGGTVSFNTYKKSSDIVGGFSRILVFGGISLFLMRKSYDMWISFGSIIGTVMFCLASIIFVTFIFYMRVALTYAFVSLQETMPPHNEFYVGRGAEDMREVEKTIIYLLCIVFGAAVTMLAVLDLPKIS